MELYHDHFQNYKNALNVRADGSGKSRYTIRYEHFQKTVFLTREEAEKVLGGE